MVEAITPARLALLKRVGAHPDLERAKLGAGEADLRYLLDLGLVRADEAGRCRATHLGEQVLKRSL
ncbi:MAG TPA: hypothetical protein VJ600_03130 [Holophagaceae bacterium]|nr:hypothetical protein [Holophagaceae bacterium]